MSGDIFTIAIWVLALSISGIFLASVKAKPNPLFVIVSISLIAAAAFLSFLIPTLDGEDAIGATYAIFFLFFIFVSFQLGAGLVWLVRHRKKNKISKKV